MIRIGTRVSVLGSALLLAACGAADKDEDVASVQSAVLLTYSHQAYLKASNTESMDQISRLSLSGDGNTLIMSANKEDSQSTGVNGDQTSNMYQNSGAAYVLTRSGGTWSQQAYLKASNTDPTDAFGYAVAVSGDGNTIAVGAPEEDSGSVGIGGNQWDNSLSSAGAVYVFTRAAGVWSQQAYIKARVPGLQDAFGEHLALSNDGSTLVVAAYLEDSSFVGVDHSALNSAAANDLAPNSGAVYVFKRTTGTWAQQAYLKASNTGTGDNFGNSVAISSDGSTIAVGAPAEASNGQGVGANQGNNSAANCGAAYVFKLTGSTWAQQAYIKATNAEAVDRFGSKVTLSGNGNTLAVGAPFEDGVAGNPASNASSASGAIYMYTRSVNTWSSHSYLKAPNVGVNDNFGLTLSLSSDGGTLATGTTTEDSNAIGVGGDMNNDLASNSGVAYTFYLNGSTWTFSNYIKASNSQAGDYFGAAVALSADASTLAVVSSGEASNAKGVNGDQTNNSASLAGAAYVLTGL